MTVCFLGMLILVLLVAPSDSWSIAFVDRLPAWLVAVGETVTDVALARWYIALGIFTMVCFSLVHVLVNTRDWKMYSAFVFAHALFVTSAMAAVWILVRTLKIAIGRARPEFFGVDGPYQLEFFEFDVRFWSFPSGHAANAGVLTAVLMLWFPRWRALALTLGAMIAALRVAIEEHYPTDVVAGFLMALLITILLARWTASRSLLFRTPSGRLIPYARQPKARCWARLLRRTRIIL